MKKYNCILSIILATLAQGFLYSKGNVIFPFIGFFVPLIIGLLFARYIDKKADKAKRLLIFTIVYCLIVTLIIFCHSYPGLV